ncbi:hypothetical protein BDP27DRAFT_1370253 [Rhodocollybia butyracea]|uniref:Uncharacterized protein n=1 Tax=Rhodocollybia butyracea TaxID=206335 RepID=A0A9P5P9G4_9AGAR|nr:hypothetical protein BDP27DRAFT_1370253 [Rhodocollybia butyracea]
MALFNKDSEDLLAINAELEDAEGAYASATERFKSQLSLTQENLTSASAFKPAKRQTGIIPPTSGNRTSNSSSTASSQNCFAYIPGGIYQAVGTGQNRMFRLIDGFRAPVIQPLNISTSDGNRLYVVYWGHRGTPRYANAGVSYPSTPSPHFCKGCLAGEGVTAMLLLVLRLLQGYKCATGNIRGTNRLWMVYRLHWGYKETIDYKEATLRVKKGDSASVRSVGIASKFWSQNKGSATCC